MRVFYLPVSSCELSTQELRESMRRWHWRRYFQNLRISERWQKRAQFCWKAKDSDSRLEALQAASDYHAHALYHRKLAQALEKALQDAL